MLSNFPSISEMLVSTFLYYHVPHTYTLPLTNRENISPLDLRKQERSMYLCINYNTHHTLQKGRDVCRPKLPITNCSLKRGPCTSVTSCNISPLLRNTDQTLAHKGCVHLDDCSTPSLTFTIVEYQFSIRAVTVVQVFNHLIWRRCKCLIYVQELPRNKSRLFIKRNRIQFFSHTYQFLIGIQFQISSDKI